MKYPLVLLFITFMGFSYNGKNQDKPSSGVDLHRVDQKLDSTNNKIVGMRPYSDKQDSVLFSLMDQVKKRISQKKAKIVYVHVAEAVPVNSINGTAEDYIEPIHDTIYLPVKKHFINISFGKKNN